MTLPTVGLIAAYVLLAALLAAVLLASPLNAWLKAVTVVTVTLFYFVTYHAVHGLMGWPTATQLPQRSLVLASYAIEPDRERGDQGVLYVWADPIVDDRPQGRPRAYLLPYSAELHARLEEAATRSRNGRFQVADVTDAPRASGPAGAARRLVTPTQALHLYDLPDPRLPEK